MCEEKRGSSEIVVTDEMIEAGLDAYYDADPRVTTREYMVFKIFEAMVRACRTLEHSSVEWPHQK